MKLHSEIGQDGPGYHAQMNHHHDTRNSQPIKNGETFGCETQFCASQNGHRQTKTNWLFAASKSFAGVCCGDSHARGVVIGMSSIRGGSRPGDLRVLLQLTAELSRRLASFFLEDHAQVFRMHKACLGGNVFERQISFAQ